MNKLQANKGEWSELYVLSKLIYDRVLYSAGNNLEKSEFFYPISEISASASSQEKTQYLLKNADEVLIFFPEQGTRIAIKRQVIKDKISVFLNEIKNGKQAFTCPSGIEIQNLLCRKSIKSTTRNRADLILKFYDGRVQKEIESGFSIKSQMGSPSTLFNASGATNLIYEVILPEGTDKETVNNVPYSARVKKIYHAGGKLNFIRAQSNIFEENLRTIDSNFPKILAEAVLLYLRNDVKRISDLTFKFVEEKFQFSDFIPSENFFLRNIKKFLLSSAMGMVAATQWDGTAVSGGGIIVVKKDGEIIGYTPYNINDFEEYLLKNTKFDTPDHRLNFGSIYEESGKLYIKLNFQVRFTR